MDADVDSTTSEIVDHVGTRRRANHELVPCRGAALQDDRQLDRQALEARQVAFGDRATSIQSRWQVTQSHAQSCSMQFVQPAVQTFAVCDAIAAKTITGLFAKPIGQVAIARDAHAGIAECTQIFVG